MGLAWAASIAAFVMIACRGRSDSERPLLADATPATDSPSDVSEWVDAIGDASTEERPTAGGVLCLMKLPPPRSFMSENKGSAFPDEYDDSQEARERRMGARPVFEVHVDQLEPIVISQNKGGCADNLSLSETHAVRIMRYGSRFAIVVVRFWDSPVRQLVYDPYYSSFEVSIVPSDAESPSCQACE